jgi:hypothetical protein
VAPTVAAGGKLLGLVLVLTILEGGFRKWAFPESDALRYGMYFSKDVVLLVAALVGASSATAVQRRYAGLVLLATVALILPCTLATLGNASLVGAILSLRAYAIVPLCAFMAAPTVRSMRCVDQIAIIVGVAAIGEVALGMVQFELPNSHWLNRYDAVAAQVGAEFGHVRATGTFSYIGGMVTMGGAAAWAGCYLFLSRTTLTSRAFAATVLLAGLVCTLLAMSRTGVLFWAITAAGSVLCFRRGLELAIVGALALAAYMVFSEGLQGNQEAGVYQVAIKRFNAADSFAHRTTYFFEDLATGLTEYPVGAGLGIGQPGGNVSDSNPTSSYRRLESELARIVQEVGILGLAGVLFIRLLPFALILSRWRESSDRHLLALCAAAIPFLFSAAFTNLAFNHTLSSIYWCLVAVIFGAAEPPETDRESNWNAAIGSRRVSATGAFGIRQDIRP